MKEIILYSSEGWGGTITRWIPIGAAEGWGGIIPRDGGTTLAPGGGVGCYAPDEIGMGRIIIRT